MTRGPVAIGGSARRHRRGRPRRRQRRGGRAPSARQQEKAFTLLARGRTQGRSTCRASPRRSARRTARRSTRMSFLMARRLVEAGVPFVTVFWKETRSSTASARAAAAGTPTATTSAASRTACFPSSTGLRGPARRPAPARVAAIDPRPGDQRDGPKPGSATRAPAAPAGRGRDHWTPCMSVLIAGGGVRGGQAYGTWDRRGPIPPITPSGPRTSRGRCSTRWGSTTPRPRPRRAGRPPASRRVMH